MNMRIHLTWVTAVEGKSHANKLEGSADIIGAIKGYRAQLRVKRPYHVPAHAVFRKRRAGPRGFPETACRPTRFSENGLPQREALLKESRKSGVPMSAHKLSARTFDHTSPPSVVVPSIELPLLQLYTKYGCIK